MVKSLYIDLNSECKRNFYKMYMFVMKSILKNLFNPCSIIIWSILIIVGLFINKFCTIGILLAVMLLFIYLVLEEVSHTLYIIYERDPDSVKRLRISYFDLWGLRIIGGVAVNFGRALNLNELLYVSVAGPLFPLICGCIYFVFSMIVVQCPLNDGLKTIIEISKYSIIAPLLSLIPVKGGTYSSDGYKIIYILKKKKLKLRMQRKLLFNIIKLYYWSLTKFNTQLHKV